MPDTEELQRIAMRSAAVGRLTAVAPGVHIDWDPLLRTPGFVRSTQELLTQQARPGAEPLDIIGGYLTEHIGIFQCGNDPLPGLTITRDGVTAHNGVRTIWLQQTIDGVPILGCDLRANITRDGRIVSIGSRLLDLGSGSVTVERDAISAAQAIESAAASIGIDSIEHLIELDPEGNAQVRRYTVDQCSGALRVEDCYIPFSHVDVRRGVRVVIQAKGDPNVYEVVVAGASHEPIIRRCLSSTVIEPATYRVFQDDSPTPFSPGPPYPQWFSAAARAEITGHHRRPRSDRQPRWLDSRRNEHNDWEQCCCANRPGF